MRLVRGSGPVAAVGWWRDLSSVWGAVHRPRLRGRFVELLLVFACLAGGVVMGPDIPTGVAPCIGHGDLFYPPLMEVEKAAVQTSHEHPDARQRREGLARAICGTCPWIVPCGQWAVATGERYGLWGGLSEEDRGKRRIRRQVPA